MLKTGNKCIIENCKTEATYVNKYCSRHWCEDGHVTYKKKYNGYCEFCVYKIMKNDKKYRYLINQKKL